MFYQPPTKRASFSVIVFLALVFLSVPVLAEPEGIVRYGVSSVSLQDDFFDGYGENGYLPVRLTGYIENEQTRYFTRWMKNTGGIKWFGYFGKTGMEFDNINQDLKNKNFYLIDVSGYRTRQGIRYAGIWYENKNNVKWDSFRDKTKAQMQTLHDTIGQEGWAPHRIEGYEISGDSRFISLWYMPGQKYYWHSKMTREQYDEHFDEYQKMDYLPFHLDSHTVGGKVYFSGIWKEVKGGAWIRSNRTWNVFQRYYNNYWAGGYNIDNFYAAETPNGTRFGGIWFFDGVPAIDASSSLFLRMRKQIDGAPGRCGATMINLSNGDEVLLHSDQTFATASVIKIGILFKLLREVDAGNKNLNDTINSGAAYGNNQGNWITANTDYTALQMAQFMIRSSNNWATNRMIDYLGGFDDINQEFADPTGLNLKVTRLRRYMLGGPSAYGNIDAADDHAKGIQSLSTPNEMASILRRVIQENLLTITSKINFWSTLMMDGNNDGQNTKNYIPNVVTPAFPGLAIFNKDGSLSSVRFNKSDAGVMLTAGGDLIVYAMFMDELSDDPDVPGVAVTAASAGTTALQQAGTEIAIEYP